jgi:predicted phosphate transport protein (TIGR00153 family)
MFSKLIPRDEKFFDLFDEIAIRLVRAAKLQKQLFSEPARIVEHVAAIKSVEHEADVLTHDVITRLNKSFVTPFDREDIHELASRLDDVVDLIDGTARRAVMFRITTVREPARLLADVIVRAADSLEKAVVAIKKPKIVIERGQEVKVLEEEGDAIYHAAVGKLFDGGEDPIEVMRWKELYDTMERTLDQCEDVANVLESIVLKNA